VVVTFRLEVAAGAPALVLLVEGLVELVEGLVELVEDPHPAASASAAQESSAAMPLFIGGRSFLGVFVLMDLRIPRGEE
jgi:hypothetical protein